MRTLLGLALFLVLGALPTTAQEELVGSWEGLIGGAPSMRTVLHLTLDAEGRLGGTVDSPEQNAFGLGVSEATFGQGAFSFRVPVSNGAWEGRLDQASGKLIGIWKQRGAELEFILERVAVDPLVGTWEGRADFGAMELTLVFHVGTRVNGELGASMVSPDQSPAHVPVASVEVREDGSLRFDMPSIRAVYEGKPDAEATHIEGHLLQGGGKFALALVKVGAATVRNRPQTPEPPFPYRTEDVSYANPAAENRLAGTLTLPSEGGPFAAVLLITGSGQQDRNEELFGHKPFLVIADHLTRAGLAVLRVDDRGVGSSTGEVAGATSADFATDVSAGVDFLRARADIHPDRIGLLGHSEGGLIAPMVAVERGDIAFLVLLAGPGIPGDEILYLQAALLARASGAPEAAVAMNRTVQERLFAILREETDQQELRRKLQAALEAGGAGSDSAQLEQVASPWFRYFVSYDPVPALRKVTCPVLALNGGLDLQVPPKENLGAIAAALEAGGNRVFEVKEYPGLNHLFQRAETGAVTEYGTIEETISPEVLADLAAWITKQALAR